MSDIIDGYIEDYQLASANISRKISQLETAAPDKVSSIISGLDSEFEDTDNVLRNMEIELRTQPESVKSNYQRSLKTFQNDLKQLRKDYERSKGMAQKGSLLSGGKAGKQANESGAQIQAIHERNSSRLEEARRQLIDTEGTANDIMVDLRTQRETIDRTRGNLGEGFSIMGAAGRIMNRMNRRNAYIKLMWICLILVIVAVIVIIIVAKTTGGEEPTPSPAPTPSGG